MRLIARYPFVIATVATALVVGALDLTGVRPWGQWVASAFALVIASRSAWSMIRTLREGSWGIDILAVTAIVSTVAVGDYWASLVIVLMLTGGDALEDYAAHRARRELRALLDRAPRFAHRETAPGVTTDVPVDAVAVGDLIEVRPGEVVPVDATVLDASAVFDESSLTGESLPVTRAPGETAPSGAVNAGGVVRMSAVETAARSQYQAIVALVQSASDSKAPFVRLADRVALPFTIVAFLIAGIAWAVSGDPVRFAEVLVVATPCPLLIAAPVAFLAGMSRAAHRGVIVKGGGVIEQLARVVTAAFDKTGTLTRGEPVVERVDVDPAAAVAPAEVLRLAGALEADSPHVLARAIVTAAEERGIALPVARDVEEVVAHGIRGRVDDVTVAVGRLEFADGSANPSWATLVPGETGVHVSRNGSLIGRIVLTDEVRPEARTTVDRLRALGIQRTVMLSGDAPETAARIAELADVGEAHGRLLPADKVRLMTELQPRPVLMVGDGVNDAPVLAAADVGIAMGARGATAASESADAVVMVEDLERIADAVVIARRTLRVAWQSIGWGIGLSVALMLVAAFGVLPAIAGALAQELVDVVSIVGSLRAARPGRGERVAGGGGVSEPRTRVAA